MQWPSCIKFKRFKIALCLLNNLWENGSTILLVFAVAVIVVLGWVWKYASYYTPKLQTAFLFFIFLSVILFTCVYGTAELSDHWNYSVRYLFIFYSPCNLGIRSGAPFFVLGVPGLSLDIQLDGIAEVGCLPLVLHGAPELFCKCGSSGPRLCLRFLVAELQNMFWGLCLCLSIILPLSDLDLDLYIAGTIFGHFCNGAGRAQCK